MIRIYDKKKCCGCTACKEICPVGAINMIEDDEGFKYPHVDKENCIKCNRCVSVCPNKNEQLVNNFQRKVFICQNINPDIQIDSTSGGFFSALANYILDKNGYIFGAEFDDEWKVIHGIGIKKEDLKRFRGSKYVQSDLNDTFSIIKGLLEKENWILFTGTPCQVEGLVSFLGKRYEKLVIMDFVCFSVSSPKVWKYYLKHLNKCNKVNLDNVKKIKFRDKTKYGYEYTLMTFYDDNNNLLYSSGPESNQMLRSFVSNISTRPSCSDCKFKKVNRVSDFTAWDCYNVYKYNKKLDDNKGTSHVMIHNEKAERILEEIRDRYLRVYQVDMKTAIQSEPAMTQSSFQNDSRLKFFDLIKNGDDVFDYFFKDNMKVKIERILRRSLSKLGLYSSIKRMLKR